MLLKGKPVADQIKEEVRRQIEEIIRAGGSVPRLAILRAGERSDDIAYENMLIKSCASIGMESEVRTYPADIQAADFQAAVKEAGEDRRVSGILIFRPLPEQIDEKAVSAVLNPDKDVDCMSPVNMAKVFVGEKEAMAPSTPAAVMALLTHYEGDMAGKHAVIVNRSVVLGKALSMLFLNENATVTLCHSKTRNIRELTSRADIVVTGIGKAKFFDNSYFSEKNIIVDVGINFDEDGMCGDVRTGEVEHLVRGISPVPGGVGSVTTAILLRNVLRRHLAHGNT